MQIEFADGDLQQLYQDPECRLPALGPELTGAYRKVLGYIAQAVDERDLHAMKSLHSEKLQGQRQGQHSLRLTDQWRLVIEFEQRAEGKTVMVVGMVDYY